MFERVRDFLHLGNPGESPTEQSAPDKKKPQRPATLTRVADNKEFFRHSGGWYESAGRESISIVEAARIIHEEDESYIISDEEAPDPYAPPKAPLIPHRLGMTHPLFGGK